MKTCSLCCVLPRLCPWGGSIRFIPKAYALCTGEVPMQSALSVCSKQIQLRIKPIIKNKTPRLIQCPSMHYHSNICACVCACVSISYETSFQSNSLSAPHLPILYLFRCEKCSLIQADTLDVISICWLNIILFLTVSSAALMTQSPR